MKSKAFKTQPVKLSYDSDEYYKIMSSFDGIKYTEFNKVHKLWYSCFYAILKGLNSEYTVNLISDLFYNFQMDNWKDLHLVQSEYKNRTIFELYNIFSNEANYISDRTSYDRLFRTHWLFRNVFSKQLYKLRG
jgi:hypothetical protein